MARVLSGRYELLEPLGRGGMGAVYRAHDRELERDVAVKLLPAQAPHDEDFRARFRREARAAAALAHPNIATVHDIGEDASGEEPVPYLVMELVKGETLSTLLRQAPPTPHQAAQIAVAVLDALEHSHEQGVVHRDIKPSNIMVHRANGRLRVKVMDFGIARLMSETATHLTATGMRIGTPSYMSPEQADGRPADARSDLYSLGCVLYEMLTGRPPFTGDSPAAVLFQHLHKIPPLPSELNPSLTSHWDAILATALAKDPARRHPSAAAMRQAIETGPAGPQAPLPPPGPDPAAQPGAPSFTEPTAPTFGSFNLEKQPAPGPTTPAPTAAPPRVLTRRRLLTGAGAVGLAAALPTTYYALAKTKRGAGTKTETGAGAETPSSAPVEPRLLGHPLTGHVGPVLSVAFSPDGTILATGSQDRTVRLWNVADRVSLGLPLSGQAGYVSSVAFSPDGKTLATGSYDNTVQLWDVAGRTPIGRSLTGHAHSVSSVAFSSDGTVLATGGWDGTVRLWDAAERTLIGRPLTAHSDGVASVAFTPDGTMLATGGHDNAVRLWNTAKRTPIGQPLTGHTSPVHSVAFSPDGRLLASGAGDGTVRLWDASSAILAGVIDRPGTVYSVAFSPDGKTLAVGHGDNTVRLWNVADRTPIGSPVTGHTGTVYSVAFSPDGKLLATGGYDNTVRLWRL